MDTPTEEDLHYLYIYSTELQENTGLSWDSNIGISIPRRSQ